MSRRLILALVAVGACAKPTPPSEPVARPAPAPTRVPDGLAEPAPEPMPPAESARVDGEAFTIRFDSEGDTELAARHLETLTSVAQLMTERAELTVEIRAHSDPKDMDCEYALCLSQRRARLAWQHLVKAGIAADRLELRGYGDTMPLRPSDTDADRKVNRRIEFKFSSETP